MSVGIIATNVATMTLIEATVDLGSVAANTTEEETATVVGVKAGDYVVCSKSSLDAGLLLGSCRVTADDTVAIQVGNLTGSPIDASSETFQFMVFRHEGNNAAERVLL